MLLCTYRCILRSKTLHTYTKKEMLLLLMQHEPSIGSMSPPASLYQPPHCYQPLCSTKHAKFSYVAYLSSIGYHFSSRYTLTMFCVTIFQQHTMTYELHYYMLLQCQQQAILACVSAKLKRNMLILLSLLQPIYWN